MTPSIEEDPIVLVPVQQRMLLPTLDREEGGTIRCMTNDVLLFDGCGTHTTLGYLKPEFGHVFRQVFEAPLPLQPLSRSCGPVYQASEERRQEGSRRLETLSPRRLEGREEGHQALRIEEDLVCP